MAKKPELALSGYKNSNSIKPKNRLVIGVDGKEKEGKTTFALSAPGPIAFINMDIGLEGIIHRVPKQKQIFVSEFNYRDATNPTQWAEMWEGVKKDYMTALASPDVRTIVVDTATEMWELLRMARFGKLTQVMPHHYGPVNAEYRDIVRKIYNTDKNLVLLHKVKAEYVNDKTTGRYVRSGFSDTGYLVQVNLVSFRNMDGEFGMNIKDCRYDSELCGAEFFEPMNNFPTLASMVYPDVDLSYWE